MTISNETKVTLGVVGTLIAVLVGGAFEYGVLNQKVENQGGQIVELKADVKTMQADVTYIRERLGNSAVSKK